MTGNSKTKTRGLGDDFQQLRPYIVGDDVRLIDWKATSRLNLLLLKEYYEEKRYTVLLAVDVSISQNCGGKSSKLDLAKEIASILTSACQFFHDQVAVVLFTDQIELYIPFAKGRSHAYTIMKTLFEYTPRRTRTDISHVLHFIGKIKRKDMIVFLISDFIDENYQDNLAIIARKHECVAIVCEDKNEVTLPTFGFLTVADPETKKEIVLDLRVENSELNNYLKRYKREKKEFFKKYGVRYLFLPTKHDVYVELVVLFNKRVRAILPPEWAYD